jgi:hypothetical protein
MNRVKIVLSFLAQLFDSGTGPGREAQAYCRHEGVEPQGLFAQNNQPRRQTKADKIPTNKEMPSKDKLEKERDCLGRQSRSIS